MILILNNLEYVQVYGLWEKSPEVLWIELNKKINSVTASELSKHISFLQLSFPQRK